MIVLIGCCLSYIYRRTPQQQLYTRTNDLGKYNTMTDEMPVQRLTVD